VGQALLFGLCAAAAWGVSDYTAAVLGRRGGGSFAVLVTAHAAATVLMTLMLVLVLDAPRLSGGQLGAALALGLLSVLTYSILYRALQLGPLAIVSPVVASWVVVTVGLALLVLGEPLGVVQAVGCLLIMGGVLLGSRRTAEVAPGTAHGRSGVVFAIGAMICLGLYQFLLGHLSQDAGWFLPLYVSRGAGAAVMLAVVAARGEWPWRRLDRRTLVTTALVPGGLASLGGMAFAHGAELGHISITAAAASIYPLIPVAGGVVLLRERLAVNQYAGLGAIIAGLLVLALGR
jgi:drug/metabolite transporter (DMT)-like permease